MINCEYIPRTKFMDAECYLMDLESKFIKIDFNNYYLSYSGGKDSHFLFWFIKEYLKDTKIKIVGIDTYLEHHDIEKRIYKNCDLVLKPKSSPLQIIRNYGAPCFSKMQDGIIARYQNSIDKDKAPSKSTMQFVNGTKNEGKTFFKLNNKAKKSLLDDYGNLHKISNKCCYYMKKKPANDYAKSSNKKAIIGVRASESVLRTTAYKGCLQKNGNFTPIWDLTDELLDEIYIKYKIEIPKIYNHVDRTGCCGCPYGSKYGDTPKELALISKQKRKMIIEMFKDSYDLLQIDYKNLHFQFSIYDFLD